MKDPSQCVSPPKKNPADERPVEAGQKATKEQASLVNPRQGGQTADSKKGFLQKVEGKRDLSPHVVAHLRKNPADERPIEAGQKATKEQASLINPRQGGQTADSKKGFLQKVEGKRDLSPHVVAHLRKNPADERPIEAGQKATKESASLVNPRQGGQTADSSLTTKKGFLQKVEGMRDLRSLHPSPPRKSPADDQPIEASQKETKESAPVVNPRQGNQTVDSTLETSETLKKVEGVRDSSPHLSPGHPIEASQKEIEESAPVVNPRQGNQIVDSTLETSAEETPKKVEGDRDSSPYRSPGHPIETSQKETEESAAVVNPRQASQTIDSLLRIFRKETLKKVEGMRDLSPYVSPSRKNQIDRTGPKQKDTLLKTEELVSVVNPLQKGQKVGSSTLVNENRIPQKVEVIRDSSPYLSRKSRIVRTEPNEKETSQKTEELPPL